MLLQKVNNELQESSNELIIQRTQRSWTGKFDKVSSKMAKMAVSLLVVAGAGGLLAVLWLLGTCNTVLKIRSIIRELKKLKKILLSARAKVTNRWELGKGKMGSKWRMMNGKWKKNEKKTEEESV